MKGSRPWRSKLNHSRIDWYEQILGTFDNDPGFDEMIRLGKEIRDADHGLPTPRRNSTKSAKSNASRRPKKGRA